MALAVLPLFLIGLAGVVLSQDSTPSLASAAPSIVTASGSSHATHIVTVGKAKLLRFCRPESKEG